MSLKSASERGTLYQMRNFLGRSDVTVKPKKNMNACEDFLVTVLHSYITVAAMEVLGISNMEEWSSLIPEDLWLCGEDERRKVMDSILSKIIEKYVDIRYNTSSTVVADEVLMYAKQVFSIGSIFLEYADGIREGDGDRVIRCWRYLMLIFHNANRFNYAKEAVHLLYQYQYQLSPKQAEQLIYNRFINTSGIPGRNIAADHHMEHLNRSVKSGIAALGPNKCETTIIRLGKAIGTIDPIINQFDKVNDILNSRTRHKLASMTKDVKRLANDMKKNKILTCTAHRKYMTNFPKSRSLIHKKAEPELLQWAITHLPK